jgi:hypothetical protein
MHRNPLVLDTLGSVGCYIVWRNGSQWFIPKEAHQVFNVQLSNRIASQSLNTLQGEVHCLAHWRLNSITIQTKGKS